MHRTVRIILLGFLISGPVILTVLMIWYVMGGLSILDMEVSVRTRKELTAPSGNYKAVHYTVDAGATTGTDHVVAVRRLSEQEDADEIQGVVYVAERGIPDMEWLSADTLAIIPNSDRPAVMKRCSEDGKVRIIYIGTDSTIISDRPVL